MFTRTLFEIQAEFEKKGCFKFHDEMKYIILDKSYYSGNKEDYGK